MTAEPVRTCPQCFDLFIPNDRQLGQELRSHKLYCSPQCCKAWHNANAKKWWRTDDGRRYNRERMRQYRTGERKVRRHVTRRRKVGQAG